MCWNRTGSSRSNRNDVITIQLIKIIEIENSRDLYPIRHKVLWQHKTVDNCGIEPDNFDSTFHIGAIDENGQIVGTSTFIKESNTAFDQNTQYRLRAMATTPSTRGKGVGKAIIEYALDELAKRRVELLWCDARVIACGFYENLNFEIKGEMYDVPDIGPHKLMYKKI